MKGIEGSKLGRYALRRRIALGGMAEIYLGYDPRVRRQVAVKVLYGRDDKFIRRFEREALAVGALAHDHILPLYDFGQQGPWYYLVMPYIEGCNLRDYLLVRKQLTLQEAGSFLDQVAGALQCAHEHGVVHRDVKPSNILLRPDGYAYLVDFGLAKAMMETESLTNEGALIGTPEYMAPEQSNGTSDHRSDIYSLGIILYQMLTGRLPFTADSPVATSLKHIQTTPVSPRELNSEISQAVEKVILKAMAKDPDERYQEAQALSIAYWQALTLEAPGTDGAADATATPIASGESQMAGHTSRASMPTLQGAPPPAPRLFPLTELPEAPTEEMPTRRQEEPAPTQRPRVFFPPGEIPEAPTQKLSANSQEEAESTRATARVPTPLNPAPVPTGKARPGMRTALIALVCLILLSAIPLGLLWQVQHTHWGQSLTAQQRSKADLTATAVAQTQVQLQATLAAQSRVQGPADTGPLLYGYNMYSSGGGWVNDGSQCSFSPQGYHVRMYAPYRTAWCFTNEHQFTDAKFTVQGQLLHGDFYGLVFRLDPHTPSFYVLEINSQGAYRFVRARGNNPQNWLTLIDWTPSSAIQSGYGRINTFTVLTKGSDFSFYLNGVLLNSFSDKQSAAYASGLLGLLVGGGGTGAAEAVFDNVGVYQS